MSNDPATIALRKRAMEEMFERVKETLRPSSAPGEAMRSAERMIDTLKLAIQSLAPDAANEKIQRQIARLQKDVRLWERRRTELKETRGEE